MTALELGRAGFRTRVRQKRPPSLMLAARPVEATRVRLARAEVSPLLVLSRASRARESGPP